MFDSSIVNKYYKKDDEDLKTWVEAHISKTNEANLG